MSAIKSWADVDALFAKGERCYVCFDLLRVLTHRETVVLSYLMSRAGMHEPKPGLGLHRPDPGLKWILLNRKMLEQHLKIHPRNQSNILKRLKELGLIKTKLKGLPPQRYIQIQWEAVESISR